MESEQIVSYDIPQTVGLSPEEATASLKRIHADAINVKHPYSNPHHPQNKPFQEAVKRLYEVKHRDAPGPQVDENGEEVVGSNLWPAEDVKVMGEALQGQTDLQARRVKDAKSLMSDLVKNYNFEPAEVPADIKDWQLRAWRIQKSLAQKDFSAAASAIQNELRILRADAETVTSVQTALLENNFAETYRAEFFTSIVDDILKVHRRRADDPTAMFEGHSND